MQNVPLSILVLLAVMPRRINWEKIGFLDYPGIENYPYRDKYSAKDEYKYFKGKKRAKRLLYYDEWDRRNPEG